MSNEEYNYSNYVFSAYKTSLRTIENLISSDDIDFKEIKNNQKDYDKMKWIIFQDILRKYEGKAFK